MKHVLPLVALVALLGCQKKAPAPEEEYFAKARELDWYAPAKISLEKHVSSWHARKGRPVSSAKDLGAFVGHPLTFTIRRGTISETRTIPWTDISLVPRGRFKEDPTYFDYDLRVGGLSGTVGVKLPIKGRGKE